MELIKILDGLPVPYSFAAFRADNKHTVYGGTIANRHLNAQDVYRVSVAPKPETTDTQIAELGEPILTDGRWVRSWTVRDKTAEELSAELASREQGVKEGLDNRKSAIKVLMKVCFLQENRIRTLEGAQPVTAAQFRAWVEDQIE